MEVVRFWLNNWFCGRDYPAEEPFISWMGNDLRLRFNDENWVKENKLCVKHGIVDMSVVFDITAPKEWVDKNCPNLYNYPKFMGTKIDPDDPECEEYEDRFGYRFLDYCEENIGITYEDNWSN